MSPWFQKWENSGNKESRCWDISSNSWDISKEQSLCKVEDIKYFSPGKVQRFA